ncbi:unnamed protein product [Rhizoctonia solani]|uniref:Uncharacterized protein n=1 Tax=Rhizoctonia solani TaxID=456999 RepID=A0A8H3H729_9AGAM|nr:unnamed protein product [Rhizoctonia solani]CAE6484843.1 unnamed protein product [Rhizoctonia solani]
MYFPPQQPGLAVANMLYTSDVPGAFAPV